MSPALAVTSQPDPATIQSLLDEFHRLESQLQEVREGLAHSHRLATLGTLAASIAHEFNNILTPVISYTQFALRESADVALMRSALEKAYAGSQHAARICGSLLGFARQSDAQGSASLRRVVQDALACLGREPAKDGIEIEAEVPDVQLAISPLALQQVLVNLFLNARKAMAAAGGRLIIAATVEQDVVHIRICDTGPGIPPAVLGRLFQPFATEPMATSTPNPAKGTGLGLWISRDLLRAAGGDIELDPKPRQGAAFVLTIPRAAGLPETT